MTPEQNHASWPTMSKEPLTRFQRFAKFLKLFSEADNNPKGISSKYEKNFTVSSKLEAKT